MRYPGFLPKFLTNLLPPHTSSHNLSPPALTTLSLALTVISAVYSQRGANHPGDSATFPGCAMLLFLCCLPAQCECACFAPRVEHPPLRRSSFLASLGHCGSAAHCGTAALCVSAPFLSSSRKRRAEESSTHKLREATRVDSPPPDTGLSAVLHARLALAEWRARTFPASLAPRLTPQSPLVSIACPHPPPHQYVPTARIGFIGGVTLTQDTTPTVCPRRCCNGVSVPVLEHRLALNFLQPLRRSVTTCLS